MSSLIVFIVLITNFFAFFRYGDIVNNGAYEDYSGLEDYAEFAHSSQIYLLLETLGIRDNQEIQYAASHVGVASGMVTLIRSHPYHSTMVRCLFSLLSL
jgi:hypothetical protein